MKHSEHELKTRPVEDHFIKCYPSSCSLGEMEKRKKNTFYLKESWVSRWLDVRAGLIVVYRKESYLKIEQ